MRKPHPKQILLLELLKENKINPLSIKELSKRANIASPGILYHHLNQLEAKGLIKWDQDNPKGYFIMDQAETAVSYIDKYGLAKCGTEGLFIDGNVIDRIPIQTSLLRFPASEAFIVEASGDSMEPKILEGDTVIARKNTSPESGDIIVCVHDGMAKIKQFLKLDNRIVLNSLNKKHPLIEISSDEELWIQGVVKNILRFDFQYL